MSRTTLLYGAYVAYVLLIVSLVFPHGWLRARWSSSQGDVAPCPTTIVIIVDDAHDAPPDAAKPTP